MGIFFLQVFSCQYKTQLAQSRDSWWKGEQGRTWGLCLVSKAGYCEGLGSVRKGCQGLVSSPALCHPTATLAFCRGTPGFPKCSTLSLLSPHLPCSFLAPTAPISLFLLPFPRKPPSAGFWDELHPKQAGTFRAASHSPAPAWLCVGRHGWFPDGYWPFQLTS